MSSRVEEPTIDVIIPTYNAYPHVLDTIRSVLSQTYGKIEVYVIDDGSKDHATKKVLDDIKDSRLHYIRKENGGASSARNLGIRSSNSPLVALLDSDDLWHPTKLEEQVELFNNDDSIGLVFCGIYIADEEGIISRNLRPEGKATLGELYKGNIVTGSASTVLIRRSVLEDVGVFREEIVNGEDWELWIRIAEKYKLAYTKNVLATIVTRSSSVQSNSLRMADELVRTYDYLEAHHKMTHAHKIYAATYCLINAAATYRQLGHYKLARKQLYRMIRINPHAALLPSSWRVRIQPTVYGGILFTNRLSAFFGRQYNKVWNISDLISDRLFRVSRKIISRVR